MADQAAYTALQNAWRGDSVSTAGAVTRNASSWGTTNGRRLLQSSGSDETRLPASAVGTWTNCSATCTYEVGGLAGRCGCDGRSHSFCRAASAAAGTAGPRWPTFAGLSAAVCLTHCGLFPCLAGPGQRALQPAGSGGRCGRQRRQRVAGLSFRGGWGALFAMPWAARHACRRE